MIVYTPPSPARAVPVIDLSDSFDGGDGLARVAREVHRACRETGFFYVSGHGVPRDVAAGALDAARAVFALPDETKRSLGLDRSPCGRGYDGGLQVLDPGSPPDLKESFMLGRELGADHPYVRDDVPMHGPNLWPADLPGFRARIEAYQQHMIRLGRHLMVCLAASLDLPPDHFASGLADPQCGIRLLRYPPQPEVTAFNQLGAGAHTDWGSITILLQDDLGGLEVRAADGAWIPANPRPDTFVVNIGQMTERFTAGLYRANLHRVRNDARDRARYSVATFFELDHFYRVGRASTCPPDPAYETLGDLSVGEHIAQMARASYGG